MSTCMCNIVCSVYVPANVSCAHNNNFQYSTVTIVAHACMYIYILYIYIYIYTCIQMFDVQYTYAYHSMCAKYSLIISVCLYAWKVLYKYMCLHVYQKCTKQLEIFEILLESYSLIMYACMYVDLHANLCVFVCVCLCPCQNGINTFRGSKYVSKIWHIWRMYTPSTGAKMCVFWAHE
jgi:hypothetical protein